MRKDVDYEFVALRQRFREFYDVKLQKEYEFLEEKRWRYLKRFWVRVLLCGLFVWGYSWGVNSPYEVFFVEYELTVGVLVLLALVLLGYTLEPIYDYKDDAKELLMNKILSFWGELRRTSSPDRKLKLEAIKKAGLWGRFNTQTSDDCFVGKYNGVTVAVAEEKLSLITGSGKSRHEHTVFKGVLIALTLGKGFKGKTIVQREGELRHSGIFSMGGILLLVRLFIPLGFFLFWMVAFPSFNRFSWLCVVFLLGWLIFMWWIIYFVFLRKEKLKDVKLEDVEFEKKWKVRSSDQIEARCVLTPAFMERMLEVKRRFHGYGLEFSFWKNTVLIAVHTRKDMFETTSLFRKALSYRKVQEVLSQFYAIFSAIDVLQGKGK